MHGPGVRDIVAVYDFCVVQIYRAAAPRDEDGIPVLRFDEIAVGEVGAVV